MNNEKIHEQEVGININITRKRGLIYASYNLNGNGSICEPIYDIGDIDNTMAHFFSMFLAKSEEKGYRYVPEFEFGFFVPRKLRRKIEKSARDFTGVYRTMTRDPGYYKRMAREVDLFQKIMERKNRSQNGGGNIV